MDTESVVERSAAPAAAVPNRRRRAGGGDWCARTGVVAGQAPAGAVRVRQGPGVLRGDKYLAGAYPPEWVAPSTRPAVTHGDDAAATGLGAPSGTPSAER